MADQDTTTATEQATETEVSTTNNITTALADSWFNDTPVKTEAIIPKEETTQQQQTQEQQTNNEVEEEVFDENEYIKKKWGYDSAETFENELKSLKEKTAQTFEWKNDTSKEIAELINEGQDWKKKLYEVLDTEFKIEKLSTADLNANKDLAAELVKFGIKNENKDSKLSDEDVEFLFNERYSIPAKPVKGDIEDDEDFNARLSAWQQQVSNIEKRLIIEAKIQQPKVAQLKTELAFPKIQREHEQPKPSQKDLDDFKQAQDSFLQSATKSVNDFNGFSVQVKDKDVDFTVSYAPSTEEKTFVDSKLKEFAASGFNANILLKDRWVESDGKTLKVEQMVKDLSKLYSDDKPLQKLVTDAANKRIETFLKEKKQVDVTKQPQGTFQPNQPKTVNEAVTDAWLQV